MVFKTVKRRSGSLCKAKNTEKEEMDELILPVSKLRFCSDQLQNLNYIFTKNLTQELDPEFSKAILLATSVAERLIQRLVCGIGMLDSRFSSKFLIALHDTKTNHISPNLEYIIRLDSLSQPLLYSTDELPKYSITEGNVENCPPGYARIRLHPPCSKAWAEFINPAGYLRRDKIQAKVVELLALAASENSPVYSLLVDESIFCGSPGKVVDAFTLYKLLQKPANQQVFYGNGGKNPRFPDPRDFKLAIVDKPSGIFLRIGFFSPALSTVIVEVRLLVAIGLDAWPSTSTFPIRIPLCHPDNLLYNRAAQTGLFLTGYGIHSSAWQIRLPAAELFLEKHYNSSSAITVSLQTLCSIPRDIDEEYRRHQVVHRILNRYTMRSCMFFQLEEDSSTPTELIINWSPIHISTVVLKVLDKLISALRSQKQPNYFFPSANLFVNPGHLCEDDFVLESNKIKAYMLKLFDMSLTSLAANDAFNQFLIMQKIEMNLLRKWKELVDGLVPHPNARRMDCCKILKSRRTDICSQYASRQVEYIGIVLKNMLVVKHQILQTPDEIAWAAILKFSDNLKENVIEDVIYILTSLIQQAGDEYIESLPKKSKLIKHLPTIKQKIEEGVTDLVELMRKENDVANFETIGDTVLVNVILKWLHKGLEYKNKYLRKVLQQFLKQLFATSHGASWHLDTIKSKETFDEINSLSMFAALVNAGKITPAQGLVDSVVKNWIWAKNMFNVVEDEKLRLLFIPARGKVTKHLLSLPPTEKRKISKSMHDIKIENDFSTLNRRQNYFSNLILNVQSPQKSGTVMDYVPPHCMLRDNSPMLLSFLAFHRNGEHRCCGDVLATLLAMQKVNVVREISTLLPDQERLEILEAIQKLQHERNSKSLSRPKFNTLTQIRNIRKPNLTAENVEEREKYTPKEESAGIKEEEPENNLKCYFASKRWSNKDVKHETSTLIGSCRAARIREDNSIIHFQDAFKMKSLMKHSSFKY